MKKNSQRNAVLLIFTFMAQMLIGCSWNTPLPVFTSTPVAAFSVPAIIESPDPANANAQATIDYGQNQLLEMSRKSTEVSMDMSQTESAAFQSTQDYNRRQQMELDFQATSISQNITQAAATQELLAQQTQAVQDATAAAQNRADAATQSAYQANVTQTAQAQANLDAQVIQTGQAATTMTVQAQWVLNARATQAIQAIASATAYPLTATPFAKTKAALLMLQYDREQQSFVDNIVVPLLPFVAILDLLIFFLVIVLGYRFLLPYADRPRIAHADGKPGPLIGEVMADLDRRLHRMVPFQLMAANPPGLQSENTARVEIVNPTEAPVNDWIADVEQQLAAEGGLSL